MLNWLKQPYPLQGSKNVVITAAVMGAAISLFLIIFQPFGLAMVQAGVNKILILCGYGLVTFILVVVNGILLKKLFPGVFAPERWNLGRELFFHGLINFVTIGTVNLWYTARAFRFIINWDLFLLAQIATLFVGLLPYTIVVLVKYNHLLRKNIRTADEMNGGLQPRLTARPPQTEDSVSNVPAALKLWGYGSDERLEIATGELLFVESADNYVKITYLEHGTCKTTMMRQTLKRIEEQCADQRTLLRCHRSYIVNLSNVQNVEGNAQGLKLHMQGVPGAVVPVSRSAVPAVKAWLSRP